MPGHFGAHLDDASLDEGVIGPFVRDEVCVIPPASHSRNHEQDNAHKEQEWTLKYRPCRCCRRLRCSICYACAGVPARRPWELLIGCISGVCTRGLRYPCARGPCLP